jgi:hypothetical protein
MILLNSANISGGAEFAEDKVEIKSRIAREIVRERSVLGYSFQASISCK